VRDRDATRRFVGRDRHKRLAGSVAQFENGTVVAPLLRRECREQVASVVNELEAARPKRRGALRPGE
jgi:hypothetical protein